MSRGQILTTSRFELRVDPSTREVPAALRCPSNTVKELNISGQCIINTKVSAASIGGKVAIEVAIVIVDVV